MVKHVLNLSQNYKLGDLMASYGADAVLNSSQIGTQINPHQIQWDYVFTIEDNQEQESNVTNNDLDR
jgi:hypothetical protein